ncbi:MAG: hypothetical protein JO129_01720 [Candidatus Dependentiae bacterium]|nr:hypothetical protein [Candidatus Dependentiae bacterium]
MNHTSIMTQKIIILLCSLLITTSTFPIFDTSPWIIIENKTKLDINCELETICYLSEYKDEEILLRSYNETSVKIRADRQLDENENVFIKFTLNFDCNAESTITFNPIFYHNESTFNPEITSIVVTIDSLQLKSFYNPASIDYRHFCIECHPDYGIIMTMQPISAYIKCLSNFKQTMRSIIMTALYLTNQLPY